MSRRPQKEVSIEGKTWGLVDAWRAPGGRGLGYFLAEASESDRRASLAVEVDVESLSEGDVLALWDTATPLTSTERRFSAGGEVWLAQASGPAWAESAAAGLVGVRLRCLTASRAVSEIAGVVLGDLADEELAELVDPSGQQRTIEVYGDG
jgi:hypothetical protein